jgi:hypothetical protein
VFGSHCRVSLCSCVCSCSCSSSIVVQCIRFIGEIIRTEFDKVHINTGFVDTASGTSKSSLGPGKTATATERTGGTPSVTCADLIVLAEYVNCCAVLACVFVFSFDSFEY